MSYRKFRQGIENDILQNQRSIVGVFAEEDDDSFPFAYPIGNQAAGLPELLIIGTSQGATILNELSLKMIDRGRGFADGECVDIGGKFPVKIIIADRRAQRDYTLQTSEYFGSNDYTVHQVVMPDKNGRFPGDPECREPYSTFPILRRSAH